MDKKLQNFLSTMKKTGQYDFPALKQSKTMPLNILGFNNLKTASDELLSVSFIHFFLNDTQFERLWNYPGRYLNLLKKARGVIGPDFSCYVDASLTQNLWNIFRNRVIDSLLQTEGIEVIPTLVWGTPRTWEFAFEGVPKNSIVAVGSFGCMKKSRAYFLAGFHEMMKRLEPDRVIVYGEIDEQLLNAYPGKICNYDTFCKEKWRKNNGKCKMAKE